MNRTCLVVALAAACTAETQMPGPRIQGAGHPTPRHGGVLRVATWGDVHVLDPAIGYDEVSTNSEHLLFDTLLAYAPAGSRDPTALLPQLAESYEVSPDGLTYTFHVRPDAAFSNGEPVLAEDFVFALNRVLDPQLASPGAQYYLGIQGANDRLDGKANHVSGIRALSDRILEIRLAEPDSAFPMLLAMKFATPLKKSHVDKVGGRIRVLPLGTGPFVLERWDAGQKLVFARNPHYWNRESTYLDGIVLHVLVPSDVAVLKFLRGELDLLDRISADDYVRFAATPAWQPYLMRMPQVSIVAAVMNASRPPFHDKRVREAICLGIEDRDIVKLTNGRGVLAHGMLPPLMAGHDPNRRPYPHDPERARKLLAEAGYPRGFHTTYVALADEQHEKRAQSIQADLAKIGVQVDIQLLTFPAYVTASGRGEIDFGFTGWVMDFPDPRNFLESRFHSRGIAEENSMNDARYSNPVLDALLDRARTEPDQEKRLDLYRRADQLVYDEYVYAWHYHELWVEVRQPHVMNYAPHPVFLRDFRRTWLDEPRAPEGHK
ncbi:MAG: ABC transporter substrate-binding protein [Deltaproteobacteria bacterium]|nr:ABC transporter substrate-binding protein [Deltaproteobacteria bacterium]